MIGAAMAHLIPLEDCPVETLAGFKAVLADIDDTLTLHGRLPSEAFAALEALRATGLAVVPVTGRPAGWCDHIARMWPVDGVVGENGAFYFRYDDDAKKMRRVYAQLAEERRANLDRLWKIAKRVLAEFPGAAIASDQAYREIDVAIDFREDVPPLPLATAEAIAHAFSGEGATAKISSIHVNAWFGDHDKLSMAKRLLSEGLGMNAETNRALIAFAGDSPNDAPMFAFFPNAVGVANIMAFRPLMSHLPHFVTENEGGYGFAEFAQAILDARAHG
jgi:HAD superfamily hydrolase (TIGR01484 family)